jgi:cytochrome oxidase Cu insertion factor (SCO1/SenC/PrrC family)
MADQMFMFAITAGFMIGLGIILGVARGRRSKTATTEVTNEPSYSSSSSTSSGASQEGRRVKRYNSEGKPVYE